MDVKRLSLYLPGREPYEDDDGVGRDHPRELQEIAQPFPFAPHAGTPSSTRLPSTPCFLRIPAISVEDRSKKVEKHLHVHVITVDIVKVDDVGLYRSDLLNQLARSPCRSQSVPVKQPRLHPMPTHVPLVADAYLVRLARAVISSEGDIAPPPLAHRGQPDLLGNPPRRAGINNGIYLQQRLHY